MMNAMAEFLPEAWRWVLEATLQACIIVAVIRVVQLALGKRLAPRWHYALWLLLLARMVMPWAPESSVSIFNLIEMFRAPQVESMSLLVTEVPVLLGMPEPARPVVELPEPSLWEAAWALAKSVGPFPIIWFSGMGFVLAYVALRNFMLWRAFRRARPLTDEKALALLDACRSEMGRIALQS
jgi:bla regulator protein BlaR1